MSPPVVYRSPAVVAALAIGVVAVTLALLGEPVREALQWSRSAVHHGEWWRLVTAHMTHLDPAHALINSSVLCLLAALFGHVFSVARHAIHAAIGILMIDVGLTWLGDLEWYAGLSGVLHALAAATVVRLIVDRHDRVAWGIAIFGLCKIIYENTTGALPFSGDEARVVTDVHLFGVLTGMVLGLFPVRKRSKALVSDCV